jgi:hypothetical protein
VAFLFGVVGGITIARYIPIHLELIRPCAFLLRPWLVRDGIVALKSWMNVKSVDRRGWAGPGRDALYTGDERVA